ncbi:hypothetical protein [Lacticaseibacillus paracasei]|uniref:hypothetical protein n=1 Tax=Lacticaseibacillus paracasei TaxID=1597 RepID=UPI000FF3C2C0|nr:hypothetical protein [Lacticaseibacillus paracasei]RND57701.1 hypothetical protein FAM18123_03107 [Lacticaseibacillus paracasei]
MIRIIQLEQVVARLERTLFKNKSGRFLRVLNDIVQCEEEGGSYAYAYLNNDLSWLFPLIGGLRTLIENMRDGGNVNPSELEIGAKLLYTTGATDKSSGKVISVEFVGRNDNDRWDVRATARRGPDAGVTYSLKLQEFQRNISLSDSSSVRRGTDVRSAFAKYMQLGPFSRTNASSILILASPDVLKRLEDFKIPIAGQEISFGALVLSQVLKSNGQMKGFRGTPTTAVPFVTFATSLSTLESYMAENDLQESKIYITGDRWWNYSSLFTRKSLFELCNLQGIEPHIFTTTASLASYHNVSMIKDWKALYAWFLSSSDASDPDILLKTIELSKEEEKSWRDIDDAISDLRDDFAGLSFAREIVEFRTKYFSSTVNSRAQTTRDIAALTQMIERGPIELEVKRALIAALRNIGTESYSVKLDNLLNQETGYSQDTLIVTDKHVSEAMQFNITARRKHASVRAFGVEMDDYDNDLFSTIVLINPNASQRRRWVLAGLDARMIIVYSSDNLARTLRSISYDADFVREVGDSDWIQDGTARIIESSLRNLAQAQRSEVQSPLEINEDFEKVRFEEEIDQSTSVPYESSALMATDDSKSRVSARFKVQFQHQKRAVLFGTSQGSVLVKNKQNRLNRVKVEELRDGDVVAYIRVKDSVISYRRDFSRMESDESFRKTKLNDNEDLSMDFFWKSLFLRYFKSHRLRLSDLQARFEDYGYHRSLAFYQAWSSIDMLNFVPRDTEFIRIIGELTNEESLKVNFGAYHDASANIRDAYQASRQHELDDIELADTDEFANLISYMTVRAVTPIYQEMDRSRTNRILEDDLEELV